ncbi:MAG: hypothetical protein ACRDGU_06875 [Actinomycetota bacterium]
MPPFFDVRDEQKKESRTRRRGKQMGWDKRRVGWSVLTAVLAIIGIGGIRDDLAGWWSILGWIDADLVAWLFVLAGLAVFVLFVVLPVWREQRSKVQSSHFPPEIGQRAVNRTVGDRLLAVAAPRYPSAPSRIVHKPECPNTYIEVEEKTSVEGDKVTVTRCTECGAQVVVKAADKKRLELGLPNWAAWHAWSPLPEVGMKGVWLGVKSLDDSKLAVYLCKVTGPFGEAIWNQANNSFGLAVPLEPSRGCLFPDKLWKDAPGLPLKAGEYDVEWFADNNGFDLPVKHDLFVVEGGRLAR